MASSDLLTFKQSVERHLSNENAGFSKSTKYVISPSGEYAGIYLNQGLLSTDVVMYHARTHNGPINRLSETFLMVVNASNFRKRLIQLISDGKYDASTAFQMAK
uniref:Uncharacterized protein n=1 Tax=Plectus sambesii TaxID=2011161 RepID=A0A914XA39_9BILA